MLTNHEMIVSPHLCIAQQSPADRGAVGEQRAGRRRAGPAEGVAGGGRGPRRAGPAEGERRVSGWLYPPCVMYHSSKKNFWVSLTLCISVYCITIVAGPWLYLLCVMCHSSKKNFWVSLTCVSVYIVSQ